MLFKQALPYDNARASCQARSGELLTITSAEENELLYQAYAGVSYYVWFGLSARQEAVPSTTREDWVWLSLGQTPAYQNWAQGEPNNDGGREGRCAILWLAAGGAWNDAACSESLPYACQLGEGVSGTQRDAGHLDIALYQPLCAGLVSHNGQQLTMNPRCASVSVNLGVLLCPLLPQQSVSRCRWHGISSTATPFW